MNENPLDIDLDQSRNTKKVRKQGGTYFCHDEQTIQRTTNDTYWSFRQTKVKVEMKKLSIIYTPDTGLHTYYEE